MADHSNSVGEFADYYAYMEKPELLYLPTRKFFPVKNVEARTRKGFGKWLAKNRAIHSVTWAPGLPTIIENKIAMANGWQDKPGVNTLNKYIPPDPIGGDPEDCDPWLNLGATLWGDDLEHMLNWMAYRVQHADIKINHSLLLGSGEHGIGKDMWLKPLRRAVGPWNYSEVSARRVKEKATSENPWLCSTVLQVSEVHDLGDARFGFYETTKDWAAGPPDSLLIRDLWANGYPVQNAVGVIYTSNHKLDGLFLPPQDRRHYVAWSDVGVEHAGETEEQRSEFWRGFQMWYDAGGLENCAAYLATRDVTSWDAKSPPPKTEAWHVIVAAGETVEDAEIGAALDAMGDLFGDGSDIQRPDVLTIDMLREHGAVDLMAWLNDRQNSRKIPHRIERAGYSQVINPDAKEGRWHIGDDRVVIYARRKMSHKERIAAVQAFIRAELARIRRAALHVVGEQA